MTSEFDIPTRCFRRFVTPLRCDCQPASDRRTGFSNRALEGCRGIAEKTAASLKNRQYNCFKPNDRGLRRRSCQLRSPRRSWQLRLRPRWRYSGMPLDAEKPGLTEIGPYDVLDK